jgi:uncharacterized membrane protein
MPILRSSASFLRRTIIGGVLVLLPLALILFLLGHLVALMKPGAVAAAKLIGQQEIGPFWLAAATVVTLIALAFIAGLFAITATGQGLVDRLEALILNQVPGYGFLKSMATGAAKTLGGQVSNERKVVLIGDAESGWQMGFIVAEMANGITAVYVPEPPTVGGGSLLFLPRERLIDPGITAAEAMACLGRFGTHPPDIRIPVIRGGGTPS